MRLYGRSEGADGADARVGSVMRNGPSAAGGGVRELQERDCPSALSVYPAD
jgi:hypothetical protein